LIAGTGDLSGGCGDIPHASTVFDLQQVVHIAEFNLGQPPIEAQLRGKPILSIFYASPD